MEPHNIIKKPSTEAVRGSGVNTQVEEVVSKSTGAGATKDARLEKKKNTYHPLGAAISTLTGDNDCEGEQIGSGTAVSDSPNAEVEGKPAADTENKNSINKPPQVPAGRNDIPTSNTPTDPFSGVSFGAGGKGGYGTSTSQKAPRHSQGSSLLGPGTLQRSESPVSPNSKSDKAIVQPASQKCDRCGEPGWSSGYCPKCGSGDAFGLL